MWRTDDKISQFVQSDVFRHISHKIVIVEALNVSKTLGVTMFLPSGQNYSKQFSFSTNLIVFIFHKFWTAVVTDAVNNYWGHPMAGDPVLPELLVLTKKSVSFSHVVLTIFSIVSSWASYIWLLTAKVWSQGQNQMDDHLLKYVLWQN